MRFIDGSEAETTPFIFGFAGIEATAGLHEIELRYSNWAFNSGVIISLSTIVALTIGYIASIGRSRRASTQTTNGPLRAVSYSLEAPTALADAHIYLDSLACLHHATIKTANSLTHRGVRWGNLVKIRLELLLHGLSRHLHRFRSNFI